MRAKLGLVEEREGDLELALDLFAALEGQQADFTQVFRSLADGLSAGNAPCEQHAEGHEVLREWHARWQARLAREPHDPAGGKAAMDAVNPLYIARNHLVDSALRDAEKGDLAPFLTLLDAVRRPFEQRPGLDAFAKGPPHGSPRHVTYCGT